MNTVYGVTFIFRELINCGLLLIRDQDSYWISFPSSGNFIRRYIEGKKCIIQIIKRRKFQEILENVRCSNFKCNYFIFNDLIKRVFV